MSDSPEQSKKTARAANENDALIRLVKSQAERITMLEQLVQDLQDALEGAKDDASFPRADSGSMGGGNMGGAGGTPTARDRTPPRTDTPRNDYNNPSKRRDRHDIPPMSEPAASQGGPHHPSEWRLSAEVSKSFEMQAYTVSVSNGFATIAHRIDEHDASAIRCLEHTKRARRLADMAGMIGKKFADGLGFPREAGHVAEIVMGRLARVFLNGGGEHDFL